MSTTTIADIIHITDRDLRDAQIYAILGIYGPGAYALREPDGRLMVWASESDSTNDPGVRATYRSRGPITDAEWSVVTMLAWVEEYEDASF
jgi:hypothetical protein